MVPQVGPVSSQSSLATKVHARQPTLIVQCLRCHVVCYSVCMSVCSLGNPISEISLGDLDTTVKYVSGPVTPTHPQPPLGAQAEFLGSVTFASGRHRWTVQLDNTGALPTYVYVGIAHCSGHPTLTSASSSVLSNVQGPLRSIAGTSSTPVSVQVALLLSQDRRPAAVTCLSNRKGSVQRG